MPTHIILRYSTFTQIYTHWPDRNAVLASRQCLLHINNYISVLDIQLWMMHCLLIYYRDHYACQNY